MNMGTKTGFGIGSMYGIISLRCYLPVRWFDLFGIILAVNNPERQFNNFVGSYIKGVDTFFSKNDGTVPYYVLLFSGEL